MPKRSARAHVRNFTSLAGIVGPLILAATTIIAHTFREHYDWIHQTVSQLGLGPHGWIENTGFITFGAMMIVFAEALYAGFKPKKSLTAATIVWVLIGVGFILVGIFHADSGNTTTIHGLVHEEATGALVVLFPIECFLLLSSLEHAQWGKMVVYTLIAGFFGLVLDALAVWLMNTRFATYDGVYERLLAFNGIVWLEVVAIRLFRHRRAPA